MTTTTKSARAQANMTLVRDALAHADPDLTATLDLADADPELAAELEAAMQP